MPDASAVLTFASGETATTGGQFGRDIKTFEIGSHSGFRKNRTASKASGAEVQTGLVTSDNGLLHLVFRAFVITFALAGIAISMRGLWGRGRRIGLAAIRRLVPTPSLAATDRSGRIGFVGDTAPFTIMPVVRARAVLVGRGRWRVAGTLVGQAAALLAPPEVVTLALAGWRRLLLAVLEVVVPFAVTGRAAWAGGVVRLAGDAAGFLSVPVP